MALESIFYKLQRSPTHLIPSTVDLPKPSERLVTIPEDWDAHLSSQSNTENENNADQSESDDESSGIVALIKS